MELFLVRHAEAESRSSDGSDASRALTAKGREEFEEVVAGLKRLDVSLDLVLHSPLLRAVETAELLGELMAKGGAMRATRRLVEAPSEGLLGEITGRSVALVGHEPTIADLLAWLLLGARSKEVAPFRFKKGGVSWLTGELTPGAIELVAFFPPRALRKIGRGGKD